MCLTKWVEHIFDSRSQFLTNQGASLRGGVGGSDQNGLQLKKIKSVLFVNIEAYGHKNNIKWNTFTYWVMVLFFVVLEIEARTGFTRI